MQVDLFAAFVTNVATIAAVARLTWWLVRRHHGPQPWHRQLDAADKAVLAEKRRTYAVAYQRSQHDTGNSWTVTFEPHVWLAQVRLVAIELAATSWEHLHHESGKPGERHGRHRLDDPCTPLPEIFDAQNRAVSA